MAKKSIHVSVHFTPTGVDEMQLKDKNVVVIDVLRASTSIAMALKNGAKEIIPVASIDSVVKISGSLFGDVTLRAGERNGKMIEGFNLGNSPLEYTEETIKGKSIVFMTTNGSVAMVKGRYAKNLVVAAFVNLGTVVEFLKHLSSDFTMICSGQDNHFCLEDAVCAGRIINVLSEQLDVQLIADDAGMAAGILDKSVGKGILKMLKSSWHGKFLAEIGFEEDLKVCSQVDSVPVLPMLSGNVIRLARPVPERPTAKA
jgi:2-phosphosulfolactate phosphatase